MLAALLVSCNSATRRQEQDVNFRFNRGQKLYEKGSYYKALDDFNFVVLNDPAGIHADDAQLYVGDCHYELGEFVVASSEYQRLMQRYPESNLVEQAQYKLGKCLVNLSPHYALDQKYTRQAISTLQNFLEQFPNSKYKDEVTGQIDQLRNKLSHKMYSNGHLYYVLQQYDSALIYYNQLLDKYYDTDWANNTRLGRAKCLNKLGRKEEAITQLQDLLQHKPAEDIAQEAQKMLRELTGQPERNSSPLDMLE